MLASGANNGLLSVAAAQAGARVAALNAAGWFGWPENINFPAHQWGVTLDAITDDFLEHFQQARFDVMLFVGVICDVENVFGVMKQLKHRFAGGRIFLETRLCPLGGNHPVWKAASDLCPTSGPQGKKDVDQIGTSNFHLPNVHAVSSLADPHGMSKTIPDSDYSREDPTRGMFLIC